ADLRLRGTLLEDLAHGVGIQPSGVNRTPAIDLAEDRTGLDLGFLKPEPQRRNRTRLARLTAGDADLRAGALLVGLRADDEQTQAFLGPSHVLYVEPDQLRAAQGAGKADQEQCPVTDARDFGPARH